mmetsp:Transcript_33641/g.65644  ORF Transcript_33641/g.65644 Transcript_33641/m.65644 type:complete len:256 (+) Transcript_33641:2667-3434(+)
MVLPRQGPARPEQGHRRHRLLRQGQRPLGVLTCHQERPRGGGAPCPHLLLADGEEEGLWHAGGKERYRHRHGHELCPLWPDVGAGGVCVVSQPRQHRGRRGALRRRGHVRGSTHALLVHLQARQARQLPGAPREICRRCRGCPQGQLHPDVEGGARGMRQGRGVPAGSDVWVALDAHPRRDRRTDKGVRAPGLLRAAHQHDGERAGRGDGGQHGGHLHGARDSVRKVQGREADGAPQALLQPDEHPPRDPHVRAA